MDPEHRSTNTNGTMLDFVPLDFETILPRWTRKKHEFAPVEFLVAECVDKYIDVGSPKNDSKPEGRGR